ncbi:GP88 family protein [Streptomyces cavernae]|uniref:GP88 family protein n=1 Tax=Streptomyces cavernae TaxID=2259034 RepID=UPI001390BD30|nr:hypothetical protein [Streptomyces cavernae]
MRAVVHQWLLGRGNSELGAEGIYTWSLPAWVVELPWGGHFNVCPSAGVCAQLCYARQGAYRFSNVRAAHMRNLLLTLQDLPGFEQQMTEEVQHPRYQGAHVRIHDSGDFHSQDYLEAWLRIIRSAPGVSFYCYTKEVALFKDVVEPDPPANFGWCYSLGGKQDQAIDLDTMRHADVFPSEEAVEHHGYASQDESDLLAVYGPPQVGIPANNIPHLRRIQGAHSFGALQRIRDNQVHAKSGRNHPSDPSE